MTPSPAMAEHSQDGEFQLSMDEGCGVQAVDRAFTRHLKLLDLAAQIATSCRGLSLCSTWNRPNIHRDGCRVFDRHGGPASRDRRRAADWSLGG